MFRSQVQLQGFYLLHRGQFQGCTFLQKGPKQVEILWRNIPCLFDCPSSSTPLPPSVFCAVPLISATELHINTYMCYRLQKRGPIFGFIGSKTGPKFEVEMGNYNNKKNHLPPGVGLQVYVSRGAILTFARAPFVASVTGPVCCTT